MEKYQCAGKWFELLHRFTSRVNSFCGARNKFDTFRPVVSRHGRFVLLFGPPQFGGAEISPSFLEKERSRFFPMKSVFDDNIGIHFREEPEVLEDFTVQLRTRGVRARLHYSFVKSMFVVQVKLLFLFKQRVVVKAHLFCEERAEKASAVSDKSAKHDEHTDIIPQPRTKGASRPASYLEVIKTA